MTMMVVRKYILYLSCHVSLQQNAEFRRQNPQMLHLSPKLKAQYIKILDTSRHVVLATTGELQPIISKSFNY